VEELLAGLALRQKSGGVDPDVQSRGSAEVGTPQDGPDQAEELASKRDEGAELDSAAGEAEAKETGPHFGERILRPQFIEYDFKFLCESAKTVVPEPLWPDPDKEPLPPPVTHAIVKRPAARPERKEITLFSIWTPLPESERPPSAEEG
jgi:hypothetical protein